MFLWMIYAATVGLLLTGAVELIQPLRRNRSGRERWVWAAALLATGLVPLTTTLWPTGGASSGVAASVLGDVIVLAGEATGVSTSGPDLRAIWAPRADLLLRAGWGAATLILFGYLAGSTWQLRRALHRWPRATVEGIPVRLGPVPGPAVVGVIAPEIVVPRWLLDLPPEDRRLILSHEQEHVAARDPLLMVTAWVFAALTPWNPGSWMQLRRLRGAMEADCDRRVVRDRPWAEARRYGELLVDVGARVAPGAPLAPAAFAEGGTHLERRLRTMFELYPPLSRLRTMLAAAGALGLAAAVYFLPGPDRATLLGPERPPDFEAYTQPPVLLNPMEVGEALQAGYPALLRDAGISGTTEMWVYVGADGAPTDLRVNRSSGHQQLDEAAMRAADVMRFDPALNGDEPVGAWLSVPLAFTPPAARAPAEADEVEISPPPPPQQADIAAGPTFTPYTVAPDLVNRQAIGAALEAAYPPLLRDAGIGGTTRVWFLIDDTGTVQETRVESSSGHERIDAAALEVASQMEFTPALNRDRPVAVWVAFPITFQVRGPR
ncbi:M56 family metallopeptidase [Gemmatimonadota bacterium Y43]|uniref:M56 family metallopeptidase n=1 Tax=Gaopeijia maritima TaxID=3119007 RepID=UPI003269D4C6